MRFPPDGAPQPSYKIVTPIALLASQTGSPLHETRPGPGRLLKNICFGHETVIRGPKTVLEELVYIEILSRICFLARKNKTTRVLQKIEFQKFRASTGRSSPTSPKSYEIDPQKSKTESRGSFQRFRAAPDSFSSPKSSLR